MPRRARSFFIVWGALLLVTLIAAAVIWATVGWPTSGVASVAVIVTIAVGVPGAINNLHQIQGWMKPSPAGRGDSRMSDIRRFEWTLSARELLMTLATELPSQNDLLSCARAGDINTARALLSGTADNAWQSLIQIAHESTRPDALARLLAAAAARSEIVAAAVQRYESGG